MKFYVFFFLLVLITFKTNGQKSAADEFIEPVDYKVLATTHNLLSLPDWGPYGKKYIGLSNIPDELNGLRFDLSVFPGLYRQQVNIPNVLFPSGYHPWRASGDLHFTESRHELEWKDKVYSDISFSKMLEGQYAIKVHTYNRTDTPQSLALHYMASLEFPAVWPSVVHLPNKGIWKEAVDYDNVQLGKLGPRKELPYDGWSLGEKRDDIFVEGSALANGFGQFKGDSANYTIHTENSFKEAVLVIRYFLEEGRTAIFSINGIVNSTATLKGTGVITTIEVSLGELKQGTHHLDIISTSTQEIAIDGFAIVEKQAVADLTFKAQNRDQSPEVTLGPVDNSVLLKYKDVEDYYGIIWDYDSSEVRQVLNSELDIFFRENLKNHVDSVLIGDGERHFTNIYQRPIPMEPFSENVRYGSVIKGNKKTVTERLLEFTAEKAERAYRMESDRAVKLPSTTRSEPYRFGQELMVATLLTNVVYPVYTQREYIKHNPPGRVWNSLYTWDSGFIGLGLTELDVNRGIECLNTYTNGIDEQAAFIHHGSPVPVQFYLFQELWNRTQSRELLEYFYPRLKRYHEFLAGRSGGSTTNILNSNLLKTWDYFYNSGGWDDYPAQQYVHQEKLTGSVSPVINTSQAIRTAKIMKQMAYALGKQNDLKAYDNDVYKFSSALQQHAWDKDSGYFGYVMHDSNGTPTNILRNKNRENINKGMDGAYPLVAGIVTDEQKDVLLAKLFDSDKMWTPIGLSVVDRSASSYREDGYWNGAIWFPHQWFVWKTMLDQGEAEKAWLIAKTGLDVWKKETEASYNCFEHFLIENGRGAGWHQFGGLSTPVLSWFGAYLTPGRITVGFDAWIKSKKFNDEFTSFEAFIAFTENTSSDIATVIITMNDVMDYDAYWNGHKIKSSEILPGTLNINIPVSDTLSGTLEIVRAK